MDLYRDETIRKHGAKARSAFLVPRVTTKVTFESDSQVYHWVTDRPGCRLARR